jgi:hypothetical protein
VKKGPIEYGQELKPRRRTQPRSPAVPRSPIILLALEAPQPLMGNMGTGRLPSVRLPRMVHVTALKLLKYGTDLTPVASKSVDRRMDHLSPIAKSSINYQPINIAIQ